MLNAYLTLGVFVGACTVLYKREELARGLYSFGEKPLNFQGYPTGVGFRPLWEADGLHPFEFFGLCEGTKPNETVNQKQ
eukprot:g8719.t1